MSLGNAELSTELITKAFEASLKKLEADTVASFKRMSDASKGILPDNAFDGAAKGTKALSDLERAAQSLTAATRGVNAEQKIGLATQDQTLDKLRSLTTEYGRQLQAADKSEEGFEQLATALIKTGEAAEKLETQQRRAQQAMNADDVRRYRDAISNLRTAYEAGEIGQQRFIEDTHELERQMRELRAEFSNTSKEYAGLTRAIGTGTRGVQTAIGNMSRLGLSQQVAIGTTNALGLSLGGLGGAASSSAVGITAAGNASRAAAVSIGALNKVAVTARTTMAGLGFSASGLAATMAPLVGIAGVVGLTRGLNSFVAEADNARVATTILNDALERSGQNVEQANNSFANVADTLGLSVGQVTDAALQLTRYGLSAEEASRLLIAGGASALAFGKSAAAGIDAVAGAVVTENSALLNSVGIAENIGQAMSEAGAAAEGLGEDAVKTAKAQAALNIILGATSQEVESLDTLLAGNAGTVNDVNKRFYDMRMEIGTFLTPAFVAAKQAGLELFDVLLENNAFSATEEDAESLARLLIDVVGTIGQFAIEVQGMGTQIAGVFAGTDRALEAWADNWTGALDSVTYGWQAFQALMRGNLEEYRRLSELSAEADPFNLENLKDVGLEYFSGYVAVAGNAMETVASSTEALNERLQALKDNLGKTGPAATAAGDGVGDLEGDLEGAGGSADDAVTAFLALTDAELAAAVGATKAGDAAEKAEGAVSLLGGAYARVGESVEVAVKGYAKVSDAVDVMPKPYAKVTDAVDVSNKAWANVVKPVDVAVKAYAEVAEAVEIIPKAYAKLPDSVEIPVPKIDVLIDWVEVLEKTLPKAYAKAEAENEIFSEGLSQAEVRAKAAKAELQNLIDQGVDPQSEAVRRVREEWLLYQGQVDAAARSQADLTGALNILSTGLQNISGSLGELRETNTEIDRLRSGVDLTADSYLTLGAVGEAALGGLAEGVSIAADLAEGGFTATEQWLAFGAAIAGGVSAMGDLSREAETFASIGQGAVSGAQSGGFLGAIIGGFVGFLDSMVNHAKYAAEEIREEYENLQDYVDSLREGFDDTADASLDLRQTELDAKVASGGQTLDTILEQQSIDVGRAYQDYVQTVADAEADRQAQLDALGENATKADIDRINAQYDSRIRIADQQFDADVRGINARAYAEAEAIGKGNVITRGAIEQNGKDAAQDWRNYYGEVNGAIAEADEQHRRYLELTNSDAYAEYLSHGAKPAEALRLTAEEYGYVLDATTGEILTKEEAAARARAESSERSNAAITQGIESGTQGITNALRGRASGILSAMQQGNTTLAAAAGNDGLAGIFNTSSDLLVSALGANLTREISAITGRGSVLAAALTDSSNLVASATVAGANFEVQRALEAAELKQKQQQAATNGLVSGIFKAGNFEGKAVLDAANFVAKQHVAGGNLGIDALFRAATGQNKQLADGTNSFVSNLIGAANTVISAENKAAAGKAAAFVTGGNRQIDALFGSYSAAVNTALSGNNALAAVTAGNAAGAKILKKFPIKIDGGGIAKGIAGGRGLGNIAGIAKFAGNILGKDTISKLPDIFDTLFGPGKIDLGAIEDIADLAGGKLKPPKGGKANAGGGKSGTGRGPDGKPDGSKYIGGKSEDYPVGSPGWIQAKMREIDEQISRSTNVGDIRKLQAKKDKLQKQLDALLGKGKSGTPGTPSTPDRTALKGSVDYANQQLAKARDDFNAATTDKARAAAAERIKLWQTEVDRLTAILRDAEKQISDTMRGTVISIESPIAALGSLVTGLADASRNISTAGVSTTIGNAPIPTALPAYQQQQALDTTAFRASVTEFGSYVTLFGRFVREMRGGARTTSTIPDKANGQGLYPFNFR
jgi:hypothetical protein